MAAPLSLSPPDVGSREQALAAEALAGNWLAMGPMVERFERAFADYVGAAHAVAVSSGTAALHLALRMLDVGPGDCVIAPTLTFIGGVAPITYQGAQALFVDCDPASWGLDPALLEEAIALAKTRGLRPAAILPTDLYGQACDIGALKAIADRHGVALVLDSAEGVGALIDGRHSGRTGLCAAYSFNGNKIITTGGGGMLTSDDKALIDRARYLSAAARQPAAFYEHTEVGFNYRLGAVSAAIGLAQLETVEAKIARRRAIHARYRAQLSDIPGVSFAPEAPGRRHTRWLTVMLLDPDAGDPETVRMALAADQVEARPVWKPMHMQPVFTDAPRIGGGVAERLFATGLCLPSGSVLSDQDVGRVCDGVRAALS